MGEVAQILRLMLTRAEKEYSVQSLTVGSAPVKFESSLQNGYSRKQTLVFNNSDASSGELYWGDLNVSSRNGLPIKKAEWTEIPVAANLDVYFVAPSGETGDLRVLELS